MFVVSVLSDGRLFPIRHGAICAKLEGEEDGALALAKMLSMGLGRDISKRILTIDGIDHMPQAVCVSSLRDGVIARYVDGYRTRGGHDILATYLHPDNRN
jgi:hypothetical protein